jgi:stage III sporulation protein AF
MIRNVVIIVLLTTFLDMILPSSNLQRFVKVIMGLFVVVTLLNPLINLFTKDRNFEVLAWQQAENGAGFKSVQSKTETLQEVNQQLFLENYEKQLAGQMEALVKLVQGVQTAEVELKLKGGSRVGTLEEVEEVRVLVNRQVAAVKPVRISQQPSGTGNNADKERMAKEITNIISQYFNLQPQKIKVVFA